MAPGRVIEGNSFRTLNSCKSGKIPKKEIIDESYRVCLEGNCNVCVPVVPLVKQMTARSSGLGG